MKLYDSLEQLLEERDKPHKVTLTGLLHGDHVVIFDRFGRDETDGMYRKPLLAFDDPGEKVTFTLFGHTEIEVMVRNIRFLETSFWLDIDQPESTLYVGGRVLDEVYRNG